MTIHVNIGEAKTRLSELVAAAKRGEEVIIQRAGEPEVRLVPVNPDAHRQALAEKRRAWIGSYEGKFSKDVDWLAPPFTDDELEEFGLFPGEKPRS